MVVEDTRYRFGYTSRYSNLQDVIRAAREEHEGSISKSAFFDQLFQQASLDKSSEQLIAFSLQSYLSNTWLMAGSEQEEWFTVWEGNCAYHSTIDVEYNTSIFYLMLWPRLLELTIRQWTSYEKPGGFMSHDMGKFLVGRGMEYGHDMEIEENCNFILLLHAHRKYTGSSELLESTYAQVVRLIQYVADSDTTGNGFPNIGTANTIDDAGPAVQYAKEQTYLAIKAYSAYVAVREFAETLQDAQIYELCTTKMEQIKKTLHDSAWLGDHYAVCIQPQSEGISDVWTGEALSGEVTGWDAYSIYPSNGLLYLLMTSTPVDLDMERLSSDIVEATRRSMTRYGCKHSSKDTTENTWISQNIWKDLTAAYLGVDMLDLYSKYWDYELYENAQGIGGCFVDAPPRAHLNYYPRGIVSLGIIYAMAGVQIDLLEGKVKLNPVRVPCRIPLLGFADWAKGEVPWVIGTLHQGKVHVEVTNKHLLEHVELFIYDVQYPTH
ncbi:hypothetical protein D3C73_702210 [compost metagenome]